MGLVFLALVLDIFVECVKRHVAAGGDVIGIAPQRITKCFGEVELLSYHTGGLAFHKVHNLGQLRGGLGGDCQMYMVLAALLVDNFDIVLCGDLAHTLLGELHKSFIGEDFLAVLHHEYQVVV